MIQWLWPWNFLVAFNPSAHVWDVVSSCRHPYHCLFFRFNNMPSLTSHSLPSSLLGCCLLSASLPSSSLAIFRREHLEIQFSSPHWRIGMGRMSPPLRSLKPDSVLREPWQPALALGQLYWNALTVTGLELLLLLTDEVKLCIPALHTQAWSTSWTGEADTCQRDCWLWHDDFPLPPCPHLILPPSAPVQ